MRTGHYFETNQGLMLVMLAAAAVCAPGCGRTRSDAAGQADAGGLGDGGVLADAGAQADGGVSNLPLNRWVALYGPASGLGDLGRAASSFDIINIDADPGAANFTPAQIAALRSRGALVISYLNIGSCEKTRTYWSSTEGGPMPCGANTKAQLGPYAGYPDEVWMDLSNPDYQRLIVDYVAQRLIQQGVDGFYLDNLELVEHGPTDSNGPCSAACRQGGLDLVRLLRDRYPTKFIVMQNATGNVTLKGTTGGRPFPSLLDGIAHEEVYSPFDGSAESELLQWQARGFIGPRGRPFWIATEDYVGDCSNVAAARLIYDRSRARGFVPYATDASGGQQTACYWDF